ncbi:MAG: hypothetical protein QF780_05735 [Candidatus Marinimicrobia bacterium]|jgi:hypothetical protein|nr:hypothetical protein [Candidatus Neomarinimicrobiota bacterium]|tara:strand:+ start:5880 stop:6803 length:924 start_codon:yes stop_codon:yes gene_type:complete
METSLKNKIYNAQCIGNVEPIEYMTPYPSMRSLIEGQTIKFSNQIIMDKERITNQGFLSYVQQTSNWLESIGIEPKQRVIIQKLTYPQTEILLYGIWNLGASAVLPSDLSMDEVKKRSGTRHMISSKTDLFTEIVSYSDKFEPRYKPLLNDEAILSFEKEPGVRLSHYNLLVNVNGIQKGIGLKSRTRIHCDLLVGSACWVVFQVILPIYCGCICDDRKPEVTIGLSGNDYNLRKDVMNIKKFSNNDIAICMENTAALSIGKTPLHLSDYEIRKDDLKIRGHSVMMGYLDDSINDTSFHNDGLIIPF